MPSADQDEIDVGLRSDNQSLQRDCDHQSNQHVYWQYYMALLTALSLTMFGAQRQLVSAHEGDMQVQLLPRQTPAVMDLPALESPYPYKDTCDASLHLVFGGTFCESSDFPSQVFYVYCVADGVNRFHVKDLTLDDRRKKHNCPAGYKCIMPQPVYGPRPTVHKPDRRTPRIDCIAAHDHKLNVYWRTRANRQRNANKGKGKQPAEEEHEVESTLRLPKRTKIVDVTALEPQIRSSNDPSTSEDPSSWGADLRLGIDVTDSDFAALVVDRHGQYLREQVTHMTVESQGVVLCTSTILPGDENADVQQQHSHGCLSTGPHDIDADADIHLSLELSLSNTPPQQRPPPPEVYVLWDVLQAPYYKGP